MKIKQLFHQSVRGTDMFRSLVNMYGLRQAIKEVNKLVTSKIMNADKEPLVWSDLCVWDRTPQGHDFWAWVGKHRPTRWR